MEPATGALIASAILGGIGAYGARAQSQEVATAEDLASGGFITRAQAELARAAEKAKQLEAEVAKLKSEVARCQGLQTQLDALSGPEIAFKNAKDKVLRRAGVEFLFPQLLPWLPTAESKEKMKTTLDYPSELVDTFKRMSLRDFYTKRVIKAVPPPAPAPVVAAPVVAAPAAPSEMSAELDALRGGRRRSRSKRSRKSRRRGGAEGDAPAPAPEAGGPAPAPAPEAEAPAPAPEAEAPAPGTFAEEALAGSLPSMAFTTPTAPAPLAAAADALPEVPAAPEAPAPPVAGPPPVVGAPVVQSPGSFPDYATFSAMMAEAIQKASASDMPAPDEDAPPPPPEAPDTMAADRLAKTAALALADQIDAKLMLRPEIAMTEALERDKAVAREFRDRATRITAAEWPGLKQEGEGLIAAIEEHIAEAPADVGMNPAEVAAADVVAPGAVEVRVPEAPARAVPDWRAALRATAQRVQAAAAAPGAVNPPSYPSVPASAAVNPLFNPLPPPASYPSVPASAAVSPLFNMGQQPTGEIAPVPAPAPAPEPVPAPAAVVPEPVPAPAVVAPEPAPAPAVVAPEPAPAPAVVAPEPVPPVVAPPPPAVLPPHLRGAPLARQPALSREAIEALRAQVPAPAPAAAPLPALANIQGKTGRVRQFLGNLTRKRRVVPPELPAPAPAAPAQPTLEELGRQRVAIDKEIQDLVEYARETNQQENPEVFAMFKQLRRRQQALDVRMRGMGAGVVPPPEPEPVPAPGPAPADGGIPEPPVAPAPAPQTFAESAEAVRIAQEAQTPTALQIGGPLPGNPAAPRFTVPGLAELGPAQVIQQAYRESREPPVAPENVAAVPAPVAAAAPLKRRVVVSSDRALPVPGVAVNPLPPAARPPAVPPIVSAPTAMSFLERLRAEQAAKKAEQVALKEWRSNPIMKTLPTGVGTEAKAQMVTNPMSTLKKRIKDAPARITMREFNALPDEMKKAYRLESRPLPGKVLMYEKKVGGTRKRTLKNRRGLNKRKNVRGTRRG